MSQAPWKTIKGNTGVQNTALDLKAFELLYDDYAPKAYGFITKYTDNKEQAEKIMMKVFLKVWDEINTFGEQVDKEIIRIILSTCRPLYINKISK